MTPRGRCFWTAGCAWLLLLVAAGASSSPLSAATLTGRLFDPSSHPTKFRHWGWQQRRSDLAVARKSGWDILRGGATNNDNDDDDKERYSRQVYTLGARAHGLIRSATVYLDGPSSSGLVYECAKNLALSGVKHLVLLVGSSNNNTDNHQENEDTWYQGEARMDDLGQTYMRGARNELLGATEDNDEQEMSDDALLVQYIQRLNPNIRVSTMERSSQLQGCSSDTAAPAVVLCMDRPYYTQVLLNGLARKQNWKFVAVETCGVFGRLFCDFGDAFEIYDADGETPLVTPLLRIEPVPPPKEDEEESSLLLIHCMEGEKHDVSKGDTIQFQYRNGTMSDEVCVVTDVQTPYRFVVQMTDDKEHREEFMERMNQQAASFRRVKIPQTVSFLPLPEAMEAARSDPSFFTACDLEKSFDDTRKHTVMACFHALSTFTERYHRLPTPSDREDFEIMVHSQARSLVQRRAATPHCRNFINTCAAKLSPFQAVFGAISAQEVLKAITGLYQPVRQFLLYDCDEILVPEETECTATTTTKTSSSSSTCCKINQSAPGLRHILGDDTVDKLQNRKLFVVGAGAIGCELIKNLAPMGVATGKRGKVILTDMDTIEKSNLSRQLLFRDNDIGKFKSLAAQEAALRLQPAMKVEAHSSKVGSSGGGSDHSPFDDKFWSKKVDMVLNALDNVEARLYMDLQCVANRKALVDAGTMGPKGNVQVVVPNQSESYASSVDPPEPAIPVCTLKNFPYAISHTIQWGRDLFDGLFQRRPEQANEFLDFLTKESIDALAQKFLREKGEEAAIETSQEVSEDLNAEIIASEVDVRTLRDAALQWATQLAYKLYYTASVDLLSEHPEDSLDEDGEPFWSGTRRPPKLLSFDTSSLDAEQVTINHNLIDFVRHGARLRVEAILGDELSSGDSTFSEKEVEHSLRNAFGWFSDEPEPEQNEGASTSERVRELLASVQTGPRRFSPTEFEKDDESNGHVAFVSAASNLRAIVYGIPPVDAMETRRVAGNIVPAMITTTAFVSALSCIELIKLVQGADLKRHRNAFINLALPFFAFTMPLPADEIPGLRGKQYTLWDRLVIKESQKAADAGGIKVKTLLKKIQKKVADDPDSVEVSSISCGPYMLYANFLHQDDAGILKASLWDLVNDAVSSGDDFEQEFSRDGESGGSDDFVLHDSFIDLTVVVEDTETGDEVELPPLRVKKFKH